MITFKISLKLIDFFWKTKLPTKSYIYVLTDCTFLIYFFLHCALVPSMVQENGLNAHLINRTPLSFIKDASSSPGPSGQVNISRGSLGNLYLLIKPQPLMQMWLPPVVSTETDSVELWLVKSTPTASSLELLDGMYPGKALTPLKFQALGEGNMAKLFCRCRLGLKEEERKDNVFVIHWLDTRRKSLASDAALSKTELLGEMAQAQEPLGFSTALQSQAAKFTPKSLPAPQEEGSGTP